MQHFSNQSRSERPVPNSQSPVHICLATCDKHIFWLQGRSFSRKLIPEHLITSTIASLPSDVPFNDDFGGAGKTHLCYIVHQREDKTYPRTCIFDPGSPIVQVPPRGHGNVFNSLYWRRCDGTIRNALDEVLVSESEADGVTAGEILSTNQMVPMVRLRDVIEPKLDCVSDRDLVKFERWKDAFIQRFM